MVYLRGYLMLSVFLGFPAIYSNPNSCCQISKLPKFYVTLYQPPRDWLACKEMPDATYEMKKSLFNVPLIPLDEPDILTDFPDQALPRWSELPVLDLLGTMTSETELKSLGMERRLQVSGCTWDTSAPNSFDAKRTSMRWEGKRGNPLGWSSAYVTLVTDTMVPF